MPPGPEQLPPASAFSGYIAQPARYLGKIYVDREPEDRPEEPLLYKAINVIQKKTPADSNVNLAFFTTEPFVTDGLERPAALVGRREDGSFDIVQPVLTIVSVGHTGNVFVYVTVEPGEEGKAEMRFWIHVFQCKSEEDAKTLSTHMIEQCTKARQAFEEAQAIPPEPASAGPADISSIGSIGSMAVAGTWSAGVVRDLGGGAGGGGPASPFDALGGGAVPSYDVSAPHSPGRLAAFDVDAAAELDDMYDLNMALMQYNMPAELRGNLLDAFQQGYFTGGEVTQACKGEPGSPSAVTACVV